jgi:hypothetical protein
VSGPIDRESYSKLTLYITAAYRDRPNTRPDHALVQLTVLDTNDNPPLFTRKTYQTNVYTNTARGSHLLRVEAVDRDQGANGLVQYSIEASNTENDGYAPCVEINRDTGVIIWQASSLACLAAATKARNTASTADDSAYDSSEEERAVAITLVARDTGYPPLASKAILLVNIVHRNDSAPVFDSAPFVFEFCELQAPGVRLGRLAARDPSRGGSRADISYRLLDGDDCNANELFELEPYGTFNQVWLVSKFTGVYDTDSGVGAVAAQRRVWNVTVRAYSADSSLFADTIVRVVLREVSEYKPVRVPAVFKLVFNNYKNYFLTERAARVPLLVDEGSSSTQQQTTPQLLGNFVSFSLADSVSRKLVGLNGRSGELSLRSILNSNNLFNASFSIHITGKFF